MMQPRMTPTDAAARWARRGRLPAAGALVVTGLWMLLGSAGAAQEPPAPPPQPTPSPTPPPPPERGVAVVLEPVSGRVLVHPDGVHAYRRLRERELMPIGTTVDAKEGAVRLTVARNDRGETWTAVFSEGKFTVLQRAEGSPLTTLRLTGASLRDTCGGEEATASAARKKRVRRLWGDGKGRFRTKGHYSAATVRGTRWLTEDRCDGTLTRVVRGSVEVNDFTDTENPDRGAPQPSPEDPRGGGGGAGGEDVVVSAGREYVARPGR